MSTPRSVAVRELDLRANGVLDARWTAVVSTVQATLVTVDRGFRRFPELDVRLSGAEPRCQERR
ncbi:MAG: hypothetical protein ACRCY9_21335 [Phycicoccus sp.]